MLDDGNPQGTSLSRLISDNKTPSRQSRLLLESQDNLTSSTDQKRSQVLSQVSYETHRRERVVNPTTKIDCYRSSKQHQMECQERKDRALMLRSFLEKKSANNCEHCLGKGQSLEQLI